jgi:membrane-bound lytic murein transglycosylase D
MLIACHKGTKQHAECSQSVSNNPAWKTCERTRLVACMGKLALPFVLSGLRDHITALLLLIVLTPVRAQDTWPVDSLLSTWPLHLRSDELRGKGKVTKVPDTDGLYTELRTSTPALPVFGDSLVDRFIELFSGPRRDHFRALLGASEQYMPLIERELARHGIPNELKYLPFALSAMNPQAYSNTGEAGLWMLSYPVALRNGLVVNANIDERRDAAKSTRAAARHLQELHALYADWPTAVMAFACGPANLTRARQRSGSTSDPRLLYPHFDAQQRHVLPRLMAFTFLALNAEDLDLESFTFRIQEPSDTIRFDSMLVIKAITQVIGTRPTRFSFLNPTLTGGVVPAGIPFLLPRSEAERFADLAFVVLEAQSTKPRRPEPTVAAQDSVERLPDGREAILYRIEEGDCLGCIADRFNVGLSEVRKWNDLKGDNIDVGNTLVLYVPPPTRQQYEGTVSSTKADSTLAPARVDTTRVVPHTAPRKINPEYTWYTVKSGDSLYMIAKRHRGVTAEDLMRYNKINASIRPGQRIKIPNP